MSFYPDCPTKRIDCMFYDTIGTSTCMHSPIMYNREGKAVGGGLNTVTRQVSCSMCCNDWSATSTELDLAQGKPIVWRMK